MHCLTQNELEKTLGFLESEIPPDWETHLDTCPACQKRLESVAASVDEWDSACHALSHCSAEVESAQTREDGKFESTIFYRIDFSSTEREDDSSGDSLSPLEREPFRSPDHADSEIQLSPDLAEPSHPENLGRIGRYEIERTIGRGGMGIVFKGFDAELNRPVAVKILSPHLAGHGVARQRFTREAKAAAAVVHDNVVPIFDIKSDAKQPYLVMPFVSGVSLQDYVENHGQIDTKNMLRVALQIADGLSVAHAQGLIHRDIKPANILLENGLNRVQITDFGLARAVDDAAMTCSGMIAGTPHYMSPEQTKGETLDHRSDLFSLGCVMYFMATGRTLYRGEGPYSVMAQASRGEYTPVREHNSNVPAFVADIIDKLLEVEPQDRFQSSQQLVDHLEKSLAHLHQPTVNRSPKRIWNSRKRKAWRRFVWSTVALSLTAITLVAASSFWPGSSPPNQPSNNSTWDGSMTLIPMSELDQQMLAIENAIDRLEQQLIVTDSGGNGLSEMNLAGELQALELEVAHPGSLVPDPQESQLSEDKQLDRQQLQIQPSLNQNLPATGEMQLQNKFPASNAGQNQNNGSTFQPQNFVPKSGD